MMRVCVKLFVSGSFLAAWQASTSHMMNSRALVLLVLLLAAACPAALSRHTPSVTKNELTTAQVGTGSPLPLLESLGRKLRWFACPPACK